MRNVESVTTASINVAEAADSQAMPQIIDFDPAITFWPAIKFWEMSVIINSALH